MNYEFEYSVECPISKDFAWQFWSDVANWPVVDSSVESVKLDGDFAAGTKGVTKPRGAETTEWELLEVEDGKGAVIGILLPGAVLKFHWTFADSSAGGTMISQRVTLTGEGVENYAEGMEFLKKEMPQGMQNLVNGMIKAAGAVE